MRKSDPQLHRFSSLLVKDGKVDSEKYDAFQLVALELALNLLKLSAKTNDYVQGSQGLKVIIKCLVYWRRPFPLDTCERILSIVLPYISIALDQAITSQVVVVIAKCLELNGDYSQVSLQSIVEDLILEDTAKSMIIVFSLLSTLFHIDPPIAQMIFILDQLQHQQFSLKHFNSISVVISALEALSASCVSKECRALVSQNFHQIVEKELNSKDESIRLLSTSILVKTMASTGQTMSKEDQKNSSKKLIELSRTFESYAAKETLSSDDDRRQRNYAAALEGLAYTSLITAVKVSIINNTVLLEKLRKIVQNHVEQSPWVYCSLCIFANLSEYPTKLSPEESKIRDLRNYAGQSKIEAESDKESAEDVNKRCKIILDTKITGIISRNCPRFTQSSREVTASLLRNLVTEKSYRRQVVAEGGLAVLIYLLLPPEADKQRPPLNGKAVAIASSALAKSLISVDPSTAFSSKFTSIVAVKPLIELLQSDNSDLPLLDAFEALLALTNLAAVDESCRDAIVRQGWSKIETYLTNSNTLVQRATIELICNLGMSPYCAEKFLDGSASANSRLEILAVLTGVEDLPARRAAIGALAVMSEWGPAGPIMGRNAKVIKKTLELLQEEAESSEVLIRAIVALRNVIVGCKDSQEILKSIVNKNAVTIIRSLMQKNRDSDIVSTSMECLQVLMTA